MWRKAVRRIFKLPSRAHIWPLPCLLGLPYLYKCVLKRISKFYIKLYYSENELVRFLAHACMSQSLSNMGKNVSLLDIQGNLSKVIHMVEDDKTMNTVLNIVINSMYNNGNDTVNDDEMYIIDVCLELIDMRDGLSIGNLNRHECIELLKDLTTNLQ